MFLFLCTFALYFLDTSLTGFKLTNSDLTVTFFFFNSLFNIFSLKVMGFSSRSYFFCLVLKSLSILIIYCLLYYVCGTCCDQFSLSLLEPQTWDLFLWGAVELGSGGVVDRTWERKVNNSQPGHCRAPKATLPHQRSWAQTPSGQNCNYTACQDHSGQAAGVLPISCSAVTSPSLILTFLVCTMVELEFKPRPTSSRPELLIPTYAHVIKPSCNSLDQIQPSTLFCSWIV